MEPNAITGNNSGIGLVAAAAHQGHQPAADVAPPPPRKRGRPRKVAICSNEAADAEVVAASSLPRRRSSRSTRSVIGVVDGGDGSKAVDVDVVVERPRKKRGRPRKVEEMDIYVRQLIGEMERRRAVHGTVGCENGGDEKMGDVVGGLGEAVEEKVEEERMSVGADCEISGGCVKLVEMVEGERSVNVGEDDEMGNVGEGVGSEEEEGRRGECVEDKFRSCGDRQVDYEGMSVKGEERISEDGKYEVNNEEGDSRSLKGVEEERSGDAEDDLHTSIHGQNDDGGERAEFKQMDEEEPMSKDGNTTEEGDIPLKRVEEERNGDAEEEDLGVGGDGQNKNDGKRGKFDQMEEYEEVTGDDEDRSSEGRDELEDEDEECAKPIGEAIESQDESTKHFSALEFDGKRYELVCNSS